MERFKKTKRFGFRGESVNGIIKSVELVVLEGIWDSEKYDWVDPPTVVSGYGILRPDAVAEKYGIRSL